MQIEKNKNQGGDVAITAGNPQNCNELKNNELAEQMSNNNTITVPLAGCDVPNPDQNWKYSKLLVPDSSEIEIKFIDPPKSTDNPERTDDDPVTPSSDPSK
jgi:hypothetical protein